MPFTQDEYFPGMIAYFTINQLRRDKRIRTTNPTRDTKPRPFVCYALVDGELYWTALTCTYNRCRRTVDKKWLRSPSGKFHAGEEIIIGDGHSTFAGPIEAFAELSERHDVFKGFNRPFLVREGVAIVNQIVEARGGYMPAPAVAPAAAALAPPALQCAA